MLNPDLVRVTGPLSPFREGFDAWLETAGYSGRMRAVHLRLMADLSRWLGERGETSADCGAPWVLFTLVATMVDAGTQSVQIYARRSDGSDGHVVSLPVSPATNPSVSPDGTELLYSNGSLSQLFVYRFADRSNQPLVTQGGVGHGSISPDGRTVVFGDGQNLHLVGVDTDSGAERSLLAEPMGNAAGYPVFTQDSSTVVFGANQVVQSIAVDGSHLETLLTQSDMFPNVTLSPDYTQLAAVVECGAGSFELRVYDFASLPAPCEAGRVVTTVPSSAYYYSPSWGPAGQIAYADRQDVFVVSALGGTPRVLTSDLTGPMSPAFDPSWAPACAAVP